MKKLRSGIIKTISILFSLLFVCSFVLVGCVEDGSVYNEAGGFYEIEDNEVMLIEKRLTSGIPQFYLLNFNFENEEVIYTLYSSSKYVGAYGGTFVRTDEFGNKEYIKEGDADYPNYAVGGRLSEGEMQIKKEDQMVLIRPLDNYRDPVYIEIIVRENDDIVGYGLIGYNVPNHYYLCFRTGELVLLQEDGTYLSPEENKIIQGFINEYTLIKFAWLSEKEIGKVTEEMIYSAIEALK